MTKTEEARQRTELIIGVLRRYKNPDTEAAEALNALGALEAQYAIEAQARDDWRTMDTAPKTGPVVSVDLLMADGRVALNAHWAFGDAEGLMPAFGPAWFQPLGEPGAGFFKTPGEPLFWRPRACPDLVDRVAKAMRRRGLEDATMMAIREYRSQRDQNWPEAAGAIHSFIVALMTRLYGALSETMYSELKARAMLREDEQ